MPLEPHPVALMPVRLEVRFERPTGAQAYILHVRIYPDDWSVTTFEPGLTAVERADIATFSRAPSAEAFRTLRGAHGLPRALFLGRLALWGNPAGAPNRDAVWTLPPRAALMPARWLVVAYDAGGRELARGVTLNVRQPLHAGPDPRRGTVPGPGGAPGDAGMHWLVDIGAARDAGMALQLTLPAGVDRVDRLIAVGVRSDPPDAAGDQLGALIEEQAFSRGAGFLAPGTPTNSTDMLAGASASDALSDEEALRIVQRPAPFVPGPHTNGRDASDALGAPARFFASLPDADKPSEAAHDAARRALHAAVWPATWGYFLGELTPEAFSAASRAETIERGRRLFRDHVRARVPQPILRLGRQPYGVLPVTPLALWAAHAEYGELAAFLNTTLKPKWMNASRQAPQVGTGADDLLAVLGLEPAAAAYRARSMVGAAYVGAIWRFLRKPLGDQWRAMQTTLASEALQGLPWTPRVRSAVFAEATFPWNGALVQDEPVSDQPVGGDGGYLRWMASASWRALRDDTGGPLPGARRPLLYLLLRQAVLRSYADGLSWMPDLTVRPDPEPELIDVDPVTTADAAQRTLWDVLELPYRGTTVAGHLEQLTNGSIGSQTGPSPVRAVRDAILALADVSSATLQMLLTESLDLCSYRLDAWMSALAQSRLAALRAPAAKRTYVGAYGWLAGLRPGSRQPSAGYIIAPSPAHAVAGGVLASGHLAHTRRAEPDSALALDLSSARVALAMWLLEGVRGGQRPGALLGYRFERRLLDGGLGQYVDPFRQQMARVSGATPGGATPSPGSVIDGVALRTLWAGSGRDRRLLQGGGSWPAIDPRHVEEVATELDEIDRAADALADLLVAEGVFQMTQGNRERAAAALDAAAGNSAALPDPDFIRTPRSGAAQTHRLAVLLPPVPTRQGATPRWQAEPRIAAWAAQLLPRTQDVRVTGRWLDRRGGAVGDIDKPLTALVQGLEPVDLLFTASGSEHEGGGELAELLRYRLLETRPPEVPADATPVLRAREVRNAISLAEFGEIARALREVIRGSRALGPADLAPAGEAPQGPHEDVGRRVDGAIAALAGVAGRLERLVRAPSPDPAELARALLAAFGFGVPGAVPRVAPAATEAAEVLVAQADVVRAEAARRVTAATAEKAGGWTVERGAAAIRHLFGDGFLLVPAIAVPGTGVVDLTFAASDALQRNNPAIAAGWLTRVARVRAGTRRIVDLFTYAEALQSGPSLRPKVAQLPVRAADTWIALDAPAGTAPRRGTSMVAIVAEGFQPSGAIAGLLVDEWVEVVPSAHETLGAAFHFDAPNAAAPNAILLAVPPEGIAAWDESALALTVQQALEQAMIRAVDPDAMPEVGHFLPALYFPLNMRGAAIATDLFDARAVPLT
jgi:hypothetical protein